MNISDSTSPFSAEPLISINAIFNERDSTAPSLTVGSETQGLPVAPKLAISNILSDSILAELASIPNEVERQKKINQLREEAKQSHLTVEFNQMISAWKKDLKKQAR